MSTDLFSSLSSELGRYRQVVDTRSGGDVVTFPGIETDGLGRVLFSNLEKGGGCTHLVTGHRAWNCPSEFFESARAAARCGLKIERAFLLPARHFRHDPSLKEHVGLDLEAGIRTLVLYVGDVIASLAERSPESLEFGLWDGGVCTMANLSTPE